MKLLKTFTIASVLSLTLPAIILGRQQQAVSLEPIVPHVADVRVKTMRFENTINNVIFEFEENSQFAGRVMWLDEQTLTLQIQHGSPELKIPVDAITHFEMKKEKSALPVAIGIALGGLIGLIYPIGDDVTHPALVRMYYAASGVGIGVVSGLVAKRYFPERWVEVPLAQVRLGIKR